ncbi:MAG: GreA/GreB family elongation factor [bacterium]
MRSASLSRSPSDTDRAATRPAKRPAPAGTPDEGVATRDTTSYVPVSPLPDAARELALARLTELERMREEAAAESVLPGAGGDAVDRTGSIDAAIRLEILEEQIAETWLRLQSKPGDAPVADPTAAVVHLGSPIRLSFPPESAVERFVVDDLHLAAETDEVITPHSPLGRTLLGASAGEERTFTRADGRPATVRVVAVGR